MAGDRRTVREFTVVVDNNGRVTLRAPDATADGQAWAVSPQEVPLSAARAAADALGIRHLLEAGLADVLDRLDRVAATEEARVAATLEAKAAAARFRASLGGAGDTLRAAAAAIGEERYCGGGLTDVGSLHAPHRWAQDPLHRRCPGAPT